MCTLVNTEKLIVTNIFLVYVALKMDYLYHAEDVMDWRQAAPGRYTEGAWFCSSASNLRRMLFPSNMQQTIEALAGGSAGAVGQTFSMIWSKIVPGRASANELHDEVR